MNCKDANTSIHCRVASCHYHCDDQDFCTLSSIQVEPSSNCHSGKACDESMCGSYKCK